MGQVGWRILDLHPEWVSLREGRTGMGVRFLCPTHHSAHAQDDILAGHELRIWFSNPCDGGPPANLWPRAWRTGDSFETMTLAPEGSPLGDPFEYGSCGRFWIADGELAIASDGTIGP